MAPIEAGAAGPVLSQSATAAATATAAPSSSSLTLGQVDVEVEVKPTTMAEVRSACTNGTIRERERHLR